MVLNYDYEFQAGMRDAENDINRRGTYYANYMLQGQDANDPYIKGYSAYLYDYVDMYGEWGENWEEAIKEEYGD